MPAPLHACRRPSSGRVRQRLARRAAVTIALVALAACGASAAPATPAGHGSPASAATGFLQEASAGHTAAACGFVLPAQAAVCTSAFTSGGAFSVQGLRVGHTTVVGDRALVTALGRLCTGTTQKQCFTSSDAGGGQPTEGQSFDAAYNAVENGTSTNPNDPAVPCQSVAGQWYVDLGQTASPQPAA